MPAWSAFPSIWANAGARGVLFEELGRAAKRAVTISEGLIVYLTAAEVSDLARESGGPGLFSALADRPLFASTADDAAEAGRIAPVRASGVRSSMPPDTRGRVEPCPLPPDVPQTASLLRCFSCRCIGPHLSAGDQRRHGRDSASLLAIKPLLNLRVDVGFVFG